MYSKKVKTGKKLFQCYQLLDILVAKLTQNQRQTHRMLELEGSLAVTKPIPHLSPLGKLRLNQLPWTHRTNKRQT